MPNDRPPPPPFVDRTLDSTFPHDGDSYRILWDEAGLFPVDMDEMPVALGRERQFFRLEYTGLVRRTERQNRKIIRADNVADEIERAMDDAEDEVREDIG